MSITPHTLLVMLWCSLAYPHFFLTLALFLLFLIIDALKSLWGQQLHNNETKEDEDRIYRGRNSESKRTQGRGTELHRSITSNTFKNNALRVHY
jgi:hypothetical protein